MTFLDTNILLDLVGDEPSWAEWSAARLAEAQALGPLRINDVVWAEFSFAFATPAEVDSRLAHLCIEVERTPPVALFRAARAHAAYRRRGGTRTGVLPDFFIGAHAACAGARLLTRDPRRFREYFPDVALVAPQMG